MLLNSKQERHPVYSGRTKFQPDSSFENNPNGFWLTMMAATQ